MVGLFFFFYYCFLASLHQLRIKGYILIGRLSADAHRQMADTDYRQMGRQ
jgi:hypothetical protein